jgi:hypothetical protein
MLGEQLDLSQEMSLDVKKSSLKGLRPVEGSQRADSVYLLLYGLKFMHAFNVTVLLTVVN